MSHSDSSSSLFHLRRSRGSVASVASPRPNRPPTAQFGLPPPLIGHPHSQIPPPSLSNPLSLKSAVHAPPPATPRRRRHPPAVHALRPSTPRRRPCPAAIHAHPVNFIFNFFN